MGGLLFYDWSTLPFVLLVLVLSFTIHEWAHAYSAYKLGDSTAYQFGRVSLNPMVHLRPIRDDYAADRRFRLGKASTGESRQF